MAFLAFTILVKEIEIMENNKFKVVLYNPETSPIPIAALMNAIKRDRFQELLKTGSFLGCFTSMGSGNLSEFMTVNPLNVDFVIDSVEWNDDILYGNITMCDTSLISGILLYLLNTHPEYVKFAIRILYSSTTRTSLNIICCNWRLDNNLHTDDIKNILEVIKDKSLVINPRDVYISSSELDEAISNLTPDEKHDLSMRTYGSTIAIPCPSCNNEIKIPLEDIVDMTAKNIINRVYKPTLTIQCADCNNCTEVSIDAIDHIVQANKLLYHPHYVKYGTLKEPEKITKDEERSMDVIDEGCELFKKSQADKLAKEVDKSICDALNHENPNTSENATDYLMKGLLNSECFTAKQPDEVITLKNHNTLEVTNDGKLHLELLDKINNIEAKGNMTADDIFNVLTTSFPFGKK